MTGSRNYLRRTVGGVICLAVPALFVVSLVLGLIRSDRGWFVGAWPLLFTAIVGGLNLYLSFVRGWLYRRRHSSMEGYQFVSGPPLVGWVGVVAAVILGWGAPGTALMGLALCFVDTGGLVWLLIATWRDASFWDE